MKQFLIAIDIQKDFVDGALGTEEAAAMIPAAIRRPLLTVGDFRERELCCGTDGLASLWCE